MTVVKLGFIFISIIYRSIQLINNNLPSDYMTDIYSRHQSAVVLVNHHYTVYFFFFFYEKWRFQFQFSKNK